MSVAKLASSVQKASGLAHIIVQHQLELGTPYIQVTDFGPARTILQNLAQDGVRFAKHTLAMKGEILIKVRILHSRGLSGWGVS